MGDVVPQRPDDCSQDEHCIGMVEVIAQVTESAASGLACKGVLATN